MIEQNKDTKKRPAISETWNLDGLFKGLDDPELPEAIEALETRLQTVDTLLAQEDGEQYIEDALIFLETVRLEAYRILGFLSLNASADTRNTEVRGLSQRVQRMLSPLSKVETRLKEEVAEVADLAAYLEAHPKVQDYRYLLERAQTEASHTFSRDVEEMIGLMNLSAGGAWSQLVGLLTSTMEVDWPTKEDAANTVNLSTIRNLASDPNAEVRKAAYEAELASYPQVETSIAAALNAIKTQVNMLADKRGYDSALDMAVDEYQMERKSLDVLIEVMEAKRPILQRYMKMKAKLLGHSETEALPWWDIVAPVGKNEKSYTIEEARDLLIEVFTPLSADITAVIERSFDEAWIDIYPRPGKRGGAFCSFQPTLKESRMLTNYNGSYDAISTLAHELGHAYHGYTIKDHRPLNQSYSMPVAETASTFNETHLTLHMYEQAESTEEKLSILDNYLTGAGQTIVDILSRFVFEKTVFERVQETYLDEAALKEIMLEAQRFAYGEAVQEEHLHPYMWACKGHYYSTGRSFYNFPYAFGQLFSAGLYRRYQEEGADFMPVYAELLKETTVSSVEDTAAAAGIDLSKPDFWEASFEMLEELVDSYEQLVKEMTDA